MLAAVFSEFISVSTGTVLEIVECGINFWYRYITLKPRLSITLVEMYGIDCLFFFFFFCFFKRAAYDSNLS